MRPRDRVVVSANWSSFFGMAGEVTQVKPHLMVKLDGDTFAMRFGEREVSPLPASSSVNMTGAE